jgi:flagellin-like protein
MSALNAILWVLASLPCGQPDRAVGSIFTAVIFIAATLVALVASDLYIAQFIWVCAFATPVIEAVMEARRKDVTRD